MSYMGFEKPGTRGAISKPTVRELAWAAGFLEGEGSFQRLNSDRLRGTQVTEANQKGPEPLRRLRRLFGGWIGRYQNGRGIYWRWRVHGARARGVMLTLYPFLSKRRKTQIRHAIADAH